MTMRVEKDGPITTVILSRLEVRNAVDWQTAAALAKIFRDFDADDTAKVAVLYGDHGVFCATEPGLTFLWTLQNVYSYGGKSVA